MVVYIAEFLQSLPTTKILFPAGILTLVTATKNGSYIQQNGGQAGVLQYTSGFLGFVTGWIYAAGNTCAYDTAKLADDVKPNEENPKDSQIARDEKRKTTLVYLSLNTLANALMYQDTPNGDVKAWAGAGIFIPWTLMAYYWSDFDKKEKSTPSISLYQNKTFTGLIVNWSY